MNKFCAIIPAYNPDDRIFEVIKSLEEYHFHRIIVVNDGSADNSIFEQLQGKCDILTHYINYGKGRAMKTALNYYMNMYSSECCGVVFADCDNQHNVNDIVNCCKALAENESSLILGARCFNEKNVPFKSRYGNKITSLVFRYLCGINVTDTQTGLRAIGNETIPYFLAIDGERFEYETNMLIECQKRNIPIREVRIATVYIDENKSSSFNPIKDSVMIYKVLLKYLSSSIIAALVDILVFTLLIKLLKQFPDYTSFLIATLSARIISSLINFILNHKFVFTSDSQIKNTIFKYYTLCIVQAGLSYGLVLLFTKSLFLNAVLAKIIVDTILFFVSFKLQKGWVFKNERYH